MADNVAITAGSGTTIATDDVAGAHYQKMKLYDGTADSTAAIPGDATNGLDVDVTRLPALVAGTASIGGAKDNGPHWASVYGVSGARYTSADRSSSAASVTDAPTGGQKIVVTDIVVSVDTAMRVDFKEETSGTVVMSVYLPANGMAQITPRSKLKLATADKALQVQTSVAGNIAVTAFYFSEA